jgi:hypothetical protein
MRPYRPDSSSQPVKKGQKKVSDLFSKKVGLPSTGATNVPGRKINLTPFLLINPDFFGSLFD